MALSCSWSGFRAGSGNQPCEVSVHHVPAWLWWTMAARLSPNRAPQIVVPSTRFAPSRSPSRRYSVASLVPLATAPDSWVACPWRLIHRIFSSWPLMSFHIVSANCGAPQAAVNGDAIALAPYAAVASPALAAGSSASAEPIPAPRPTRLDASPAVNDDGFVASVTTGELDGLASALMAVGASLIPTLSARSPMSGP